MTGDRRGSSTTTGTLLMVGLAFLLATGAAAGTFLIASSLPSVGPRAGFAFDYDNDDGDDALAIRHVSGDELDGDNLTVILVDAVPTSADGDYRWNGTALGGGATASPGDGVTLNATSVGDGTTLNLDGATVRVASRTEPGTSGRVFATWEGPDTDRRWSNDRVRSVDGATDTVGADGDEVSFVLENAGTSDVRVTHVTVESTSAGATVIKNPHDCELAVNRTGGCGVENFQPGVGSGIGIGADLTHPLNATAPIPAGERTRFTLGNFEDAAGNEVEMGGQTLTVRVRFDDGSELSVVLSVPSS